jgi:hypothetical protein
MMTLALETMGWEQYTFIAVFIGIFVYISLKNKLKKK